MTGTFSGALDLSQLGYAVGTPFSGTFTYSTDVPSAGGGVWLPLPAGALTLDIGGDILTSTDGNSGAPDFLAEGVLGGLEIVGNSLSGTGPIAGGAASIGFSGSSDPIFSTLSFPFPFPMDFTGGSILLSLVPLPINGELRGKFAAGPITSFSAQTMAAVPEPPAWLLLCGGFSAMALATRLCRRRSLADA